MKTGPKKILVMASGEQDYFPVVFMLMRFGHEVRYFLKTHKALKELETESFDLILLNDRLPNMSGLEFLKNMQMEERRKVIFLCYQSDGRFHAEITSLGVSQIISQSINPIQIAVAVCEYFVSKTEHQNLQVNAG